MSVEKTEIKNQESTTSPNYKTVDLEMKLLEVGELKYNIDMRQNGESRFIRIKEAANEKSQNSRTHIMVPMSCASDFHSKLMEVLKFASSYTPANISEKKSPTDPTKFAFSTSYYSPGRRRYFFDLIDAHSSLTLRICYLSVGGRSTLTIILQAVPKLAGIIDLFRGKYPSLTPSDDYPPNNYRRGGTFNRGSSRPRRGFNPGRGRRFGFGYRGNASGQSFGGQSRRDQGDSKKPGALQVLSEPAPVTITSGVKSYLFQVTEGTNTFLRINEAIKENHKSSLHIPIELVAEFQAALVDISKKYAAIKQTQSTENA